LTRANGRPAAPIYCGRVARGPGVRVMRSVDVTTGDAEAWTRGTVTCGSIWVCPPCSATIRDQRAEQLKALMGEHLAARGGIEFVTLTLRHGMGDDLGALLSALTYAWSQIMQRPSMRARRERLGWLGAVRAVEVTYGGNGWHPHLHVALFTDDRLTDLERAELRDALASAWCDKVAGLTGSRPSLEHGVNIQNVSSGAEVGKYLAKVQDGDGTEYDRLVHLEMMRGDLKQGRWRAGRFSGVKGLTPFELLDLIGSDDERTHLAALRLWHEYEVATKSRRAITGMTPLLRHYGLDVDERTDVEIAETEPPEQPDVVVSEVMMVDPATWMNVCRLGLDAVFLDRVEDAGAVGGREVLAEAQLLARAVGPPDLDRVL
jgi:hypothetical protein